ncbi:MAG: single-stranded-DNA-specific exonuclease RecJ [Candidatus Eisenbacteria bacterium]|nr:single-stranded-DNA-specific exonuclease RecJ [Candidatus Eisenbacteria bacterium]
MRRDFSHLLSQPGWKRISPGPSAEAITLSQQTGIFPQTAQLCINRGLGSEEEVRQFLSPNPSLLHDPFLMKDMDKAVERLRAAVKNGENILVCGDYDVDGITSTFLLGRVIESLDGHATYFIPDRMRDGYGFSQRALEVAREKEVSLIVTVDCGVSSASEIRSASSMSIDVIVTDHHEVPGDIPPACAVVNPRRPDCPYPFKELAGVGVAYKLALALVLPEVSEREILDEYLDVLALGAIADLVPLVGENRVFAKLGMDSLRQGKRKGITALKEVAGIKKGELDWEDIAFVLGPRINAAGRLGDSDSGLRLLLEEDYESALMLAQLLDGMNQTRRKLDEEILDEANAELQADTIPPCIVLSSERWHPGVIGVVSSKLVDTYWRPSILISLSGGIGRGSARSIPGFDITKALGANRDLLISYGGHPRAAGFSIHKSQIPSLKARLGDLAAGVLESAETVPSIETEMELMLPSCSNAFAEELIQLSPFGPGNPEPVFEVHGCDLVGRAVTGRRSTLRMAVQRDGVVRECFGFGMAPFASMVNTKGGRISLAFTPVVNQWRGEKRVQLKLKDLKFEDD